MRRLYCHPWNLNRWVGNQMGLGNGRRRFGRGRWRWAHRREWRDSDVRRERRYVWIFGKWAPQHVPERRRNSRDTCRHLLESHYMHFKFSSPDLYNCLKWGPKLGDYLGVRRVRGQGWRDLWGEVEPATSWERERAPHDAASLDPGSVTRRVTWEVEPTSDRTCPRGGRILWTFAALREVWIFDQIWEFTHLTLSF